MVMCSGPGGDDLHDLEPMGKPWSIWTRLYVRFRMWLMWRRIPELKGDYEEDSFWVGESEV